ncbi:hypothetical protein E1B28_007303 [Marasmius oreades]|uniref:Helicase C-terminal domain-containing protein n=1 Tax=Marasmius oreades TaxID=181124 RepID=A0A9P7S229_9AGAR|nr:uncharacterized protein E1B28_007303 [Marasmius oreades]KAG7093640.1 hypothetical protein E1B28_007303 [Marasmius oreades]
MPPIKASSEGQKSIKTFFTKKGNDLPEPSESGSDSDVEVDTSSAKKTSGARGSAPDASDLPPINNIPSIFADIVSRTPKVQEVAEHVEGRKLRVATMCSGTESPLLALELIQASMKEKYHVDLQVEHVFSCEIEPFKQAYIERNFHPPLLFRDVCELGNDQAHTAYGALATVPGDVDLLVAGTSCVDYSNLNNEKQDIDANGESGRTFRGMMAWVNMHRPPLVILENVCSAPWDRVKEKFEYYGYSAEYARVDTKGYYIPHTRTRVYLVAVDARKSSVPAKWKDMVMNELRRPASSTLDEFLLPSDDPRIHQARQKLVAESYNAGDRKTGRTDWGRCESRHQRARLEEELGNKRPLTSWEEGGTCKLLDFAWTDWGAAQVERVWDLMDISLLRDAKRGSDPSYRTQVWNLSQNVDRTIGSGKVGICPCLTPSMIPYITNRGGPMVGLEALSMQGLPVDKLLLTRETEDQLADLAGNAMSTTVVGTCIIAALIIGKKYLKAGDDRVSYEAKKGSRGVTHVKQEDQMDVDKEEDSVDDRVVGEKDLVHHPLDLAVTKNHTLSELLIDASKSIRLCQCEGRTDMTDRPLVRCIDCGTPSCKKCGGRPEHNPSPVNEERLPPSEFDRILKSTLPMCLSFSSVTSQLLNELKSQHDCKIPSKRWEEWCEAVLRAASSELRFVESKRQEIWSAVYRSPAASLELYLHPHTPEWRLYAKPLDSEPANAEIRQVLEAPVGRLICDGDLLQGKWQFAFPEKRTTVVKIAGAGELVPSWGARLGLSGEGFREQKVHSVLNITVSKDGSGLFDRDISGEYDLLERCGTANGALHKRRKVKEDDLPPLFFLLDPHRTRESEDSFVFTQSIRRYEFGENRPLVAKLDSTWRQSDLPTEEVTCYMPFRWITSNCVMLQPTHGQDAQFGIPETLQVSLTSDACRSAVAFLTCSVHLRGQAGSEWPLGVWGEVDQIHERETYRAIAWLLERVRRAEDHFAEWQTVTLPDHDIGCERCAPSAPHIRYVNAGKKIMAVEDPAEAGEYERRLKRRPSAFVTQLKIEENGTGLVRVGLNVSSLLHRATSRLPPKDDCGPLMLSWRINTNFTPVAALSLGKFVLKSNKHDKEHAQPPHFKVPLRKEQLRSLEWMLRQESAQAEPFIEEEVTEAILIPLGWRAEGRTQRTVHVRGGVLADQVGYGKTAITLGLIDCTQDEVEKEFSETGRVDGKISLKASLVIVPPHLTRQWDSEVRKFTKNRFKTLVLSTVSNLNSATIEDFQEADIIIVASNIFKSTTYLENLTIFAATAALPNKEGRHFNDHMKIVCSSLMSQVDRLQDEGATAVKTEIVEGQKRVDEKAALAAQLQSKRLKGKSYREAAEKAVKADSEQQAAPSEKRLVMESVFIPPYAGPSAAPSEGSGEENENLIDVSNVPKPKRRISSKPMVFRLVSDGDDSESGSDFEDEDNDEEPKSRKKTKVKAKPKPKPTARSKASRRSKKKAEDSDESFVVEETCEEDDDVTLEAISDEEFDVAVTKKKKSNKKTSKGKVSATSSSAGSSDNDMDVDEDRPSSNTKKGSKRKSTAKDDRPVKKRKRAENDPWKLDSAAVRRDWTQMSCPPLETFHFARKIVDEYTYLDGKVHSLVTNLTAERLWVLSGTPPIHDFGALKTISPFLGVHLGIDDDSEGNSQEVKKRRRERTAVEKFHSFREVNTLEWHAHRHEHGQKFLETFVRQNIAEIDEIPWTEKRIEVVLPAAERAIYLELEHHLRALDMTIKRGRKTESDREKRVTQALGESQSAEEALLKRCSHFDLETTNENAMKACDVIVKARQKQLDQCKSELLEAIKAGVQREKKLKRTGGESMFNEWARVCRSEGVEDEDATTIVVGLINQAQVPPARKIEKDEGKQLTEKEKAEAWEHREKTHEIRRLTKELVGRVRSLRYFTIVRDLQKQRETPSKLSCPRCKRDGLLVEETSILSSCGHSGCIECVKACAEKEECVDASCRSAARVINIVHADTLGVDDVERDGRGKHFGKKLEKVIHLIKKEIPKEERVLLFVQFPDLMQKVGEALAHNKIQYIEIKGSANMRSKNLEKFQNDSEERVLLLNLMDESASGANLTNANHAIFLSPLLAPSQEIYQACETQAVGRLVRYGQNKHVYIYRCITKDTIDEEIYELRKRR